VLVGESVGEVLSHEIHQFGVPTLLSEAEGHGEARRYGESGFIPRGVGDPQHAETFSVRNLGGPRRPLSEEFFWSHRATREPRWGYAVSDGGGVGQGRSTEETYEQDRET